MKRSRPSKTKAKCANQVELLTGAEALRIKQIIEAGKQPDRQTLLRLLNSESPCEGLYSKTCKGKSCNANCLCNLIPAPESYRRNGLWAKHPEALAELGPDPASLKREKPDYPVGLRNLGNTCYVNSVLQCLFANRAFRRAVYAVRPPVSEHPAVKELRQLFLELEYGATSIVDPGPLVGALQLDHGVQQDGHEFMKLLLTMLEMQFARQQGLKDVIPTLFRGQSGYETVCQACHRPSESSSRTTPFYELDVPVKGFKSLKESLDTLLLPEFLCDDNQYSCDFCAAKVDATRQLRLRSLPPILCLSLQRFIFDYNKMDRVKATNKFAFPLELDMTPYLGQVQGKGTDSTVPPVYDLVAILIHKGGSAMHGHYVAHINMDNGEEAGAEAGGRGWWRFDDEGVTLMKGGPFNNADHGGAAGKRPAGEVEEGHGSKQDGKQGGRGQGRYGSGRGRSRQGRAAASGGAKRGRGRGRGKAVAAAIDLVDDGEEDEEEAETKDNGKAVEDLTGQKDLEDAVSAGAGMKVQAELRTVEAQAEIVSQNAYLLVYRQRGAELATVHLDEPTQQWLQEARNRLAAEYEQRCSTYVEAKDSIAQRTQQRQQEVRSLVEAAVAVPEDDPGHYISAAFLQKWADAAGNTHIDPIDNSVLLCPHGKLDPSKMQDMRHISTPAWEQLRRSYKGGPELQPPDACPTCLANELAAVAASEDNQGQRDHFLALAAALEEGSMAEEGSGDYLISKHWLSAWQKRSGRTMGATSPTAPITCPHNQLAPEQLTKQAKRVTIPAEFYKFLKRCWDAAVEERQQKQQQQQQNKQVATPTKQSMAPSAQVEVVALDSDGDIASPPAQPAASVAGGWSGREALPAEASGAAQPVSEAESTEAELARAPEAGAPMLEFRNGCEECAVCLVDLTAAAEMAQGLRGRREAEKALLAHLVSAAPVNQPVPGRTYNLVPAVFMERWRAYMTQSGRRPGVSLAAVTPGTVAHPPSLEDCMAGVMCECHAGEQAMLAYPPPAMVNKRGRWVVAEHEDGATPSPGHAASDATSQQDDSIWQLLESEDWLGLVGVYGAGDEQLQRGVEATLRIVGEEAGAAAANGGDLVHLPGETLAEHGDATVKLDNAFEIEIGDDYTMHRKKSSRGGKRAWLEVHPPVCEATVAARRQTAKAARLTYTDQEVMVEVVASLEEATSKPSLAGGGERKSKRARKGRAPVIASSTDTLRVLRLRIYEAVDVHPGNARLFIRCALLEHDDGATLAECEIYPGDEIKVVDSHEFDSADYASVVAFYGGDVAQGKRARQREAERGFTGTILHGLHAFEGGKGEGGPEAPGGECEVLKEKEGESSDLKEGEEEAVIQA